MTTIADHRSVFEELRPPFTESEALLEADRCLECGGPYAPAPCVTACPANVDVPAFVGALARGETEAAAATIFAENLLGGTCAEHADTLAAIQERVDEDWEALLDRCAQ